MEECPCENCLVKIGCRHMQFSKFRYCQPIREYLGFTHVTDRKKHLRNFPKFYKCLKPSTWTFRKWPRGHDRRDKDFLITTRKIPR